MPEQVLLNAVGGPQVIVNEALDILCEDALKRAIDDSDIKAVGQVRDKLWSRQKKINQRQLTPRERRQA